MSWSFNPFTGNLDLVGGGAVVFEGEVETFADLPETIGDPAVGASFLVRSSTGVWLVNRRQAGIWIRRNNTGVRATDWEYGGDYPVNSVNGQTGNVSLTASDVGAPPTSRTISAGTGLTGGGDLSANRTLSVSYGSSNPAALGTASAGASNDVSRADHVHSAEVSDSAFRVLGSTDATKKIAIEVDTNVPSGQTVTLTAPSSSGTLALAGDAPAAHSSSHHTGGTDAIAPSNIGAAWAQVLSNQTITGNTLLAAGRNRRITLFAVGATANVDLPHQNNQAGDLVTLVADWSVASTLTIRRAIVMSGSSPVAYSTLATLNAAGQSFTFVSDGTETGWSLRAVDTHAHAASAITSGVLDNARVNFAAPSAIGSTTPNTVAATDLSASNKLSLPSAAAASPTAGDLYRNANTLRYRDSTNTERLLLNATDNLSNLANTATARANLGLGTSNNVTFGSIQNTPIGSTTPAAGSFTTLNANNGTLTASAPVLDLSQTWNNAAVTFTGLRFNVTNTASAAASLLMDLQTASTSRFRVDRDGVMSSARVDCTGDIHRFVGATTFASLRSNGAQLASSGVFAWGNLASNSSTDLELARDAADTFAQRRSTNPQTFRLYNTFTDANNHERGFMRWSSSVLQIGTEAGGTGSARALELQTGGTTRMTIATTGETAFTQAASFAHNVTVANGRVIGCNQINLNITSTALLALGTDSTIRWGASSATTPMLKRSSTTLQVRLADDTAFAPLECAGLTLNGNLTASTRNIVTDTTTGTRIGTGTTQLLGFWNAAPSAQPAAVADATDAASTQARLNDLLARLRTIGIIAT